MKLYAERTGLWRKFIALFSSPSNQVKTNLITFIGRTENGHDLFARVLRPNKSESIPDMQDQLKQELNLVKCRILQIQSVTVSVPVTPEKPNSPFSTANPSPMPIQKLQYIALQ